MNESIKVLHVLDSLSPGGIPKYVNDLTTSALIDNSKRNIIFRITSVDQVGFRSNQFLAKLFKELKFNRIFSLFTFYLLIKRERPIIIHTHGYWSQVYAVIVGKIFFSIPIISHLHGVPYRKGIVWKIYRNALSFSVKVIAVSRDSMCQLSPFLPDTNNIIVLTNSCKNNRVKQESEVPAQFTIGYLGRLDSGKRVDIIINSFSRFRSIVPAAKLIIGGEGPKLRKLKKQVEELNLQKSISFVGWVDDQYKFISKLSVLVLMSESEGMPISLVEAMSSGKPIIANNVGGCSEIVVNGENGILLDKLSTSELANALISLQKNPGLLKSMGKVNLEKWRNTFSWDQHITNMSKLYRDVVYTEVEHKSYI